MKRIIFLIISLCSFGFIYAQSLTPNGSDYLGVWCHISVDLENDATSGGYLKYTITLPPEGITYAHVEGPGSPYLFGNNGKTADLYVKGKILAIEAEFCNPLTLDLYVDKWYDVSGNYTTSPVNSNDINVRRCYYRIVLNIMQ